MKTTKRTMHSMRKILTALTSRGNYCWLLRHKSDVPHDTSNPLFNIPEYCRCKHCSHNMGEV